jgi:hypothetical protein
MTMDLAGNIFVADWGNNAIRIISTNGIVSTYAGTITAIVPTVTLVQPIGLTQDSFGNIIVATLGRILKIRNVFYSAVKVTSKVLSVVKPPKTYSTIVSLAVSSSLNVNSKSMLTIDAGSSLIMYPKKTSTSIERTTSMKTQTTKFATQPTTTSMLSIDTGSSLIMYPKETSTPIECTTSMQTKTNKFATQPTTTPELSQAMIKYPNVFPENLIFFSIVPKKNQPPAIQIMGLAVIEIYFLFILVSAYYKKWRTPFYRSTMFAFTFLIMNTLGYMFFLAYNIDRTIKISDNIAAALTLSVLIFTGLTEISIIFMLCTRIREIWKVFNLNLE